MCVILLQINEVFMFYFCELYHEIIKQDILSNGGECLETGKRLYIYRPINLHGGEVRFVDLIYKRYRTMATLLKKTFYHEEKKYKCRQ